MIGLKWQKAAGHGGWRAHGRHSPGWHGHIAQQGDHECGLRAEDRRDHEPHFLSKLEDKQPNGRRSHRFWQRGCGYDRNLTELPAIWATIDYLHANPLRRGLCERAIDWIWSSALEWEQPGTGLLRLDRSSLPSRR